MRRFRRLIKENQDVLTPKRSQAEPAGQAFDVATPPIDNFMIKNIVQKVLRESRKAFESIKLLSRFIW